MAEYLSVTKVARRLGVSDESVRNYIKAGLFPGARRKSPLPHSNYEIPLVDVEQFERDRSVNGGGKT